MGDDVGSPSAGVGPHRLAVGNDHDPEEPGDRQREGDHGA